MRYTGTASRLVFGGALLAGCAEQPSPSAASQPQMTASIFINLIEFGIVPQRITLSVPPRRDTISANKGRRSR